MSTFPIGASSTANGAAATQSGKTSPAKDAQSDFLSFMKLSTEEKYLEMYLRDTGLTKEEFDALPIEDQQKIMDKIREKMRKDIEEKTGII